MYEDDEIKMNSVVKCSDCGEYLQTNEDMNFIECPCQSHKVVL